MPATEERYEFGKNWHDFITRNFGQEKVDVSRRHMLGFMQRENLDGLSFLDIGCGSGLHSIAALQSGAGPVHGFDYDPDSVAASRYVRSQAGDPAHWTVERGSVLDEAYVESLPLFDVVYSWGVLHHTGDVWRAIRNAGGRVKPGGLFYIALYAADVQKPPTTPEFWLDVKRRYVNAGPLERRWMELWYIWRFELGGKWHRLGAFLRRKREYEKNRGMAMMTDIRDWLGGWPMEFCWDDDVKQFVARELDMELLNIATGEANSEFLFRRHG